MGAGIWDMERAMKRSARKFRRNFNGGIPVSAQSAGIGVEFNAPEMSLSAVFWRCSILAS